MNIGYAQEQANELFTPELDCLTTNTPEFDVVTIIDGFKRGLATGKTFSFIMKTLKNPISMSPQDITLTTFAGLSQSSLNAKPNQAAYFTGFVDTGKAAFTAKKPSPIDPS